MRQEFIRLVCIAILVASSSMTLFIFLKWEDYSDGGYVLRNLLVFLTGAVLPLIAVSAYKLFCIGD